MRATGSDGTAFIGVPIGQYDGSLGALTSVRIAVDLNFHEFIALGSILPAPGDILKAEATNAAQIALLLDGAILDTTATFNSLAGCVGANETTCNGTNDGMRHATSGILLSGAQLAAYDLEGSGDLNIGLSFRTFLDISATANGGQYEADFGAGTRTMSVTYAYAAVPLPASALLLIAGLCGVIGLRTRLIAEEHDPSTPG